MVWRPDVTVAAIAEREGRFLMVEERIRGCLVYNQPAGHLERGETLIDAVVRETREETAWEFEPDALVGLYLWSHVEGVTTLRACFTGRAVRHHPHEPLDEGIERALWLTREELDARASALRTPLVMQCVEDYLAGQRVPLEALHHCLGDTESSA
ncbi:MAG TPA: NUDIX hydrolase [Gammaproteobacteria bacterium]|nr:NUDIX hydrolase [Gammaproteobacteria bacterium]